MNSTFRMGRGQRLTSPRTSCLIHTSRRDKLIQIIRDRVPDAANLTAYDLASHEGYYSVALARYFKTVRGYEIRDTSRDAARS